MAQASLHWRIGWGNRNCLAPRPMPRVRSLEQLRNEIDAIDTELLALLNQRAALCVEVGRRKMKESRRVFAPEREKRILQRLEKLNPGPLRRDMVRPIYREIISACRSLEQRLRVAFLGPEGTFSHQAAREQFGQSGELLAVPTISAVFDEVEHGRADYGIVPVENSTEGAVTATLDRFVGTSLTIKAEAYLNVNLLLLSKSGRPDRVKRIVSMPQPLGQCREWLKLHFPSLPLEEVSSTAKAAERAAADPRIGAIAGVMAQERHGLKLVASGIQDQPRNLTRFLVIGNDGIGGRTGDDKTSLLFSVRHEPGALYRVLRPFADNRINMLTIESRPLKGRPWEYFFFLDVAGHVSEARMERALASLRPRCVSLRILGTYPVSRVLE